MSERPTPQLPPLTGMAMKLDAFNARAVPLDQSRELTPDPEAPPALRVLPPVDHEPTASGRRP